MRDPDAFDRCYAETRSRLLQQTFALTGDLQASRGAVRDAFVAAWHHWDKVGRLPNPEDWIRPRAWRLAQRRHTGRIWHRDRKLDPEVRATLDALGKLSVPERKALLLTQLTALPLPEIARELGIPLAEAERRLQTATASFTTHREVPTSGIRLLLDQLQVHVESHRWPRSTIVRRAGATRRRTHTALGAVAVVGAVLASGAVVTDATGVRPDLRRHAVAAPHTPSPRPAPTRETTAPPAAVLAEELSPAQLVDARQLAHVVPGRTWRTVATSDNSRGDGLVLPCQTQRYADPADAAALARSFHSTGAHQAPLSGAQLVEFSGTPRAARRAYRTTVGWFAGCTDDRTQLILTRRVSGVGDEAVAFVLRDWDAGGRTIVAQVSRTGVATTSVVTTVPGAVPVARSLELLSDAVNGVCNLPGAGRCAGGATAEIVDPLPAGVAPAMLGEFDLPPVATVRLPWVATDPHRAVHNLAATGCDNTSFHQPGMKANMTRSFVVPGSKLPQVFGLTQSVARLPPARAAALVAGIRDDLARCPDRRLGTKVSRLASTAPGPREMTVWHITTEISDQQSVTYLMGIARNGGAVTQVGFVPSGRATMSTADFMALMRRADQRLARL